MTHGTGGSDKHPGRPFFDANGTEFPKQGSTGNCVPL